MSPPLCPISRGGGERVGLRRIIARQFTAMRRYHWLGPPTRTRDADGGEYRSLGPNSSAEKCYAYIINV